MTQFGTQQMQCRNCNSTEYVAQYSAVVQVRYGDGAAVEQEVIEVGEGLGRQCCGCGGVDTMEPIDETIQVEEKLLAVQARVGLMADRIQQQLQDWENATSDTNRQLFQDLMEAMREVEVGE